MPASADLCSPGKVGIFVLSEKLGESIVVTLPDGKWFVVDAFKGSGTGDGPGPVGRFIEHFRLPVEDCLFVLLTHLHEDHYSGIPRLLRFLQEKGDADSAKRPRPPFATHPAYRVDAIADEVERMLDWQALHATPQDKHRGLAIRATDIAELCRKDYEDIAPWRVIHRCHDAAAACRVFAFLPAKAIEARYLRGRTARRRLAQLADKRPADPNVVEALMTKQNTILNDMSLGLVIELGRTVVLLTGDGEVEAWEASGNDPGPQINPHEVGNPLSRATFLKVPHHASKRAWNPVLEDVYVGCDWVIATHHERGGYCLPTADGLEPILRKNVVVAIPDRALLKGIPDAWHARHLVRFDELSVDGGRNASTQDVEMLKSRYPGGQLREPPADEVQWVGALLDADNTVQQWLGGSRATFLKAWDPDNEPDRDHPRARRA